MAGRDFLLIADAVAPLGEGVSSLGAAGLSRALREPWVPRDRDAVRRLFAGLRLVEPGLVQVDC